jgi:hypothetical protein
MTTKQGIVLAVLVLLMVGPTIAAAQFVQGGFQGGPPPGPPPPGGAPFGGPGRQGGPPRDPRAAPVAGTAVIRGRIFASDTGRPLRRARIQVTAPELAGDDRTTSTNAEGRYEIRDLPAGRYTITVNRSGYLRLSYGQRRPYEQGKPLQLADRQAVENVDFTLPRMSLITGRVLDEANEPIAGVRVMAMRSAYFEGARKLVPAFAPLAVTDDAGQYRLLGLTPGTYYVEAETRETWTVTEQGIERVMGYARTYFPGTTGISDARRVTVGVGEEMSNIDLALIPGRAADVSGMALDSQGRPLAGRQVQVLQDFRAPGGMRMVNMQQGAAIAGDGSFRIRNLPPGDYKLQVQNNTDVGGVGVQEAAATPITIDGVDIDNIGLITSVGWSVIGRVVTDTGDTPNIPPARMRVLARPLSEEGSPVGGPGGLNQASGRLKDDWTFIVPALHGPVHLRLDAPDDWAVKAILQDGVDVTDRVFDLNGSDTLGDIQIVITNKVSSVTGALTDDKGAPTTDGTIIVFASEADRWAEDSRFVRSARPDQQGKFQIKGLPAGDYLAVGIDYVEDGMWNDPEYLESVRRYGEKVRLGDAGSQTIALKLVSP